MIICTGSVPRAIPGHGRRRRADRHLRPGDQQHRRDAARAGRGDRRRRDRRRVRLGLHRPRGSRPRCWRRCRTACCRSGPDRDIADVLAKSLAEARHEDPRGGPGRRARARPDNGVLVPFETPKGSEKIEVDQVLVSIGRRPVTEGMGAGGGRACEVDRPRVHRGRHRTPCRPPGRASTRSVTACPHRGSRTSPTPRRSSRWTTSSARTRCRWTTARCRGSSTPIPRWPGRG